MKKILTWIRDWWRGYSEADISSAFHKMTFHSFPGKIIILTKKEYKAVVNHLYRIP